MMPRLILFPCNGNSIEALDGLLDFRPIGFVDDSLEKIGTKVCGLKVFDREILQDKSIKILAVPGSPTSYQDRANVILGLKVDETRFIRFIHPKALVSPFATIGFNVMIQAGVVVGPNVTIGNHVCILPNTVIHHDSIIGDYSLLGSNVVVAGHTDIGSNCYIGSGSSIINNIKIGAGALIGMGSNVIQNVKPFSTNVGNPSRAL